MEITISSEQKNPNSKASSQASSHNASQRPASSQSSSHASGARSGASGAQKRTTSSSQKAAQQRSASGQRTSSGQRGGTSQQRSASGQRPADPQRRTSNGQRPANGQPRTSSGQRPANSQQRAQGQRPANGQAGAKKRKKKRGVSPVLIVLIVALVAAIAIFGGIGVYAMRYVNYDKILPNVYVAGVDVGGMTKEEAKAAIEAAQMEEEPQSVNVNLPDQVLTFTPEQDTILMDVDQAVDAAYSYGRNSSNPFSMARAIKAAQKRRNDIDISTAVQVDTDYIRGLIDDTAQSVSTPLSESQIESDERTITVTIGTPGKELDADALYALVANAFSSGDYSDIDFDYSMTYPANVSLDQLYEEMTTDPENAEYDPDSGTVLAETVGYTPSVSLDEANQQLAMASPGDVLTFTFDETEPEITKEHLESVLFRDTLYSYGTVYAANAGRTTNLRLACEAIDGTVLQPGETFSFNEVVGERTAEKGYQEATVYVSGDSVPALGGGVCQVASTIYYCAMYADLEIVHREPHMFFVTYVTPGLDATIYWGSVDFQFKNSTGYPLRIDAGLSGGKCNIALVGTDVNNYTIKIDSKKVSTTPYSTVTKEGTGENQSGYTGYVYEITRYVYDSSGNLIRTDSTADLDNMGGLGTSNYNKRDQVTYTGSSGSYVTQPPSEEPTTSTSPSVSPSAPVTTPPVTTPPVTTPPVVSTEPDPPVVSIEPVTPAPADPVAPAPDQTE